MNLKERFLRFLLKVYYYSKFEFEVHYNDFDPKRKDPYFLVGNHPCLQDGIYTSVHLNKYPFPIINTFMFVNPGMKFLLTKIIHSIPKRKGQNDIKTIRELMRIIKKGRGIMLFPEGNSSYFGEGGEIPFSTVKLFKKMKLDVVVILTNGAYLTMPRWGKKATRKGLLELNFKTLYTASQIETMTEEEIYEGLTEALKFNDFDWNRKRKYLYKPKKRASGLENYIYYCPKCGGIQTIYTKKNTIFCEKCGEIAHFNEYSMLEGLDFDNLIEWNRLQKQQIPEIAKKALYSHGEMFKVDTMNYTSYKVGYVDAEIIGEKIFIMTKEKEMSFDLAKMTGFVLTRTNELSFDYGEDTYFITFRDPMLFYDAINYLKGGLK